MQRLRISRPTGAIFDVWSQGPTCCKQQTHSGPWRKPKRQRPCEPSEVHTQVDRELKLAHMLTKARAAFHAKVPLWRTKVNLPAKLKVLHLPVYASFAWAAAVDRRIIAKSEGDAGQDHPWRGEVVPTPGRGLAELRLALFCMERTPVEEKRHSAMRPRHSRELGGPCRTYRRAMPRAMDLEGWLDAWWRQTLETFGSGWHRPSKQIGTMPPTPWQTPMGRRDTSDLQREHRHSTETQIVARVSGWRQHRCSQCRENAICSRSSPLPTSRSGLLALSAKLTRRSRMTCFRGSSRPRRLL